MTGSSPAMRRDRPWCWDRHSGTAHAGPVARCSAEADGPLQAAGWPPRGDQLPAHRRALLSPDWAPEAVSDRCGVPAATIRRIAAELADVAFEQEIELDIPWTDHLGRYPREDGGPPGLDACHARHLGPCQRLPDLPHAAPAADHPRHHRCAGRLPLQAALSQAGAAGRQARGQAGAGEAQHAACPGRRSAS